MIMSKATFVKTNERELSVNELDQASGGAKGFHYVEMNGDTWAANGNGAPVQVTHNYTGILGWLLN